MRAITSATCLDSLSRARRNELSAGHSRAAPKASVAVSRQRHHWLVRTSPGTRPSPFRWAPMRRASSRPSADRLRWVEQSSSLKPSGSKVPGGRRMPHQYGDTSGAQGIGNRIGPGIGREQAQEREQGKQRGRMAGDRYRAYAILNPFAVQTGAEITASVPDRRPRGRTAAPADLPPLPLQIRTSDEVPAVAMLPRGEIVRNLARSFDLRQAAASFMRSKWKPLRDPC